MLNAREEDREVADPAGTSRDANVADRKDGQVKLSCTGSCHCGKVRFLAAVDPSASSRKCNCSWCTRTRFWKVFVGTGDFHLVGGNESLGEYRFGNDMVGHFFCNCCGTSVFMRVDLDDTGAHGHVVNLACLDDAARRTIAAVPVVFEDGRNDNWWVEPQETRHL